MSLTTWQVIVILHKKYFSCHLFSKKFRHFCQKKRYCSHTLTGSPILDNVAISHFKPVLSIKNKFFTIFSNKIYCFMMPLSLILIGLLWQFRLCMIIPGDGTTPPPWLFLNS